MAATMTEETIRTVCWAFVAVSAIQAFALYCVVRVLATGHGIFEARHREPSRIFGAER